MLFRIITYFLQMEQANELIIKTYVVAYTQEFVKVLEETAERLCPMDCNWIDEETQTYVFRANKTTPNFKSWAAYYMYPIIAHTYVIRDVVLDRYFTMIRQYDLCDEDEDVIFYRFGDPFYRVLDTWKDDFDMCLYELLLE